MDIMEQEPSSFGLRILHNPTSLLRQQYENAPFRIQRPIPAYGQQILTLMENGLVKTELLMALPQICDHMLAEDTELETILGPQCLEELARLLMVQMAWKDSKSGKIPWNESHRSLLMEKSLSDRKKKASSDTQAGGILRGRLMLRRRAAASPEQANRTSSRPPPPQEADKEPEMDKTKYGSQLQVPTTAKHGTSSIIATKRASIDMNIPANIVSSTAASSSPRSQMVASLRHKDPSEFYFLWDLIINLPGGTQTTTSHALKEQQESISEKKINILELIRKGLNSKYEDHVRKSLREKDLNSLLCILSLLTDKDISALRTHNDPHSSLTTYTSHHQKQQQHLPQHHRQAYQTKKKKLHKTGCRKQSQMLQTPDTDSNDEPVRIMISTSESCYDSNSDTDFQSEIRQILERARELEQGEPLVQIFPFYQEDTLDTVDSLNLPSDYSVDEIETEINALEDAHLTGFPPSDNGIPVEGGRQNATFQTSRPQSPVPDQDEEERLDMMIEQDHNIIVELANFLEQPAAGPLRSNLDLARVHDRLLSTHEEITEESETKSDETKRSYDEDVSKADKSHPEKRILDENQRSMRKLEEETEQSICEAYWEAELRRSYQRVLNLLSFNSTAQSWIRSNLVVNEQAECSSSTSLKSFRFLFRALVKLTEDRLGMPMEENLMREKRLRERWGQLRRLTSELASLQKEMKALEHKHIPYMLTLDFQIRILNSRLRKIWREIFRETRDIVRDTELNARIQEKAQVVKLKKAEESAVLAEESCQQLKALHEKDCEKLKLKRKQWEQSLEATIAHYDKVMFQEQQKLDDTIAQTIANERRVKEIQAHFADISSRYVDMCAEKKLKQIMKNMEMADELKRNRAAKIIQDCWRRYRIRKRKRERRKARRAQRKKGMGAPSFASAKKKTGTPRDSESPPSIKSKT